jgi:hypothetical protein
MRFAQENFFTWAPQERFQFIYDYTCVHNHSIDQSMSPLAVFEAEHSHAPTLANYSFFCAIPPSLRVGWGESVTRLIAPGGFLATLVYPVCISPRLPTQVWQMIAHSPKLKYPFS